MAGKMSLSPTITADPDRIKAVQVKVPVVATVIQSIDSDGKMNFIVEPPGPENEHGKQTNLSRYLLQFERKTFYIKIFTIVPIRGISLFISKDISFYFLLSNLDCRIKVKKKKKRMQW